MNAYNFSTNNLPTQSESRAIRIPLVELINKLSAKAQTPKRVQQIADARKELDYLTDLDNKRVNRVLRAIW